MTQSSLHKPSALQLLIRRLRKLVAPPLSEGILKSMAPKEIFSTIFHENAWKGTQSVSGKGSDRDQTQSLVTELPKLFSKYGVCSVLDVPCGDFHWMQQVDLSGVRYFGGDIVPDLIAQNESTYACPNIRFACIDLLTDALPEVDLIMCRDCLVHFSFAHIHQALRNIAASPAKFLLTTSFVDRTTNDDILTGRWRPLHLRLAPFNLPAPLDSILEGCTQDEGKYSDKAMCLWSIADLRDSLQG